MASWQDYLKLMTSLAKTLGDLTRVEQEKNAAVCAGDLAGVEACMKREQVLSLTLRGYDQKRDDGGLQPGGAAAGDQEGVGEPAPAV